MSKSLAALRAKENKARFLHFFHHNSSVMLLIDPDCGEIVDANQSAAAYYGYPLQRLVGMSIDQICTLTPEELGVELRRALRGERGCSDFRHRLADGTVRAVQIHSGPIADLGKSLLFSIVHDVTQRTLAEQALLASEMFAAATIDAVSAHICVLDEAGRILVVNQAWREFHDGGNREPEYQNSGVGANYLEICDAAAGPGADNAAAMADGIRKVIKGEREEFMHEYPCPSPAEQRWFIARVTRFRGDSRNVVVAQEDITARKMAELHEQHHNRVLQMLVEKAPLANVLGVIARDVENINPAMQCGILLLDDDGKHLRHAAAPSLPEFYTKAVDGLVIGPDSTSCGRAAYTGERVIVEDIETHPGWAPFLGLTRRAGLGACWSHPILSAQDKVLGTFAVYQRHTGQPSPAHLKLIEDEARLAALAIEKSTAEARLQLAASVFTHAREAIMITDASGNIVEVNDTFTRITGYPHDEALGQNPRILKSGRQPPEHYASMWSALIKEGHWYGETWNRRKNGEVYAEMITISAVRDATGKTQNYVALFTDITPMKEQQEQLEHIAHYDALTSLPNRMLLADRLMQSMFRCLRNDRSLAVVYLDLDGFKAVNDNYGHDVGDELLIAIAQRMKATMREGDTLARIGGDEFVAVLVDLEQPEDCEPVLARLLQSAADPVTVGDAVLRVSASIGVTIFPQDGADADHLMRHADQAMYVAKQDGKNRYHLFDVDHDTAVKTQRESIEHIRRALDRREFVLNYQPKVNMKSGDVIGVEALIRWQHPERGLLPPDTFLPIIEDHPISVEIGEWVIDAALAQISAWRAAGLEMPVSMNIGARQLQQPNFVKRLSELIAAHPDVPPGFLELEVLETSALEDMVQVSKVMHACRAIGVSFALDDFGTGYSSLTYLRRLPAKLLKIDQSFVRGMLDDTDDLSIVEGVMGLATAFRLEVIAEGVETVAHGELLLSLGFDLAQGYGIALPMGGDDLPGWVETWRPDFAWASWSGRIPNRDDRMVVFAEVKHRHWMRDIEAYLAGDRDAPPPMDARKCHFGLWQDSEGRARYGEHPEFSALVVLHDRVHALGRRLLDLHASGRLAEVKPLLAELHTLRDELIARLRRLITHPELDELMNETDVTAI